MACIDPAELVQSKIDKRLTQYRESPRLEGVMRAYLGQAAEAQNLACRMLDFFDVDTAVGDQLTILGKVVGWPRDHRAGQRRPVFGFACADECGPPTIPVAGFCEAEWDCGGPDYVPFRFIDDELYRGFLKARIITNRGDYSRHGLTLASRAVFGADAVIYREAPGRVAVATGRLLSGVEISIAHLYRQALPIAPGVRLDIWHGNGPAFGFGDGWGGFCDGSFPVQITLN
ncbi:DUF2612 domain-containing protein [Antarcticirhabdus aurantiaca]|uniref:DUF2612 domain-containing protein n=1 Tax=Antarcticirhabdus aurantiaca TaxID=2606717 RepID=A0ACD4NJZ6_9HYPH|nr:DUF2612 domain-containing protein [Antarcticirhabdus aurantiaca]WAJ27144.1 DUF2612 domain-containing protein [Jeongeuplla avenae]